jgi:hypothetical protein
LTELEQQPYDPVANAHESRDPAKPTSAVWREEALAEIGTRRFVLARLRAARAVAGPCEDDSTRLIELYLDRAQRAATDAGLSHPGRFWAAVRGASVERAWGQIDAADEAILQIAGDEYVIGQLARVLRRVRRSLAPDDPRRMRLEEIATRHARSPLGEGDREQLLAVLGHRLQKEGLDAGEQTAFVAALTNDRQPIRLTETDRESVFTAFHAANCEARRAQSRVRSFRNMLYACAVVLAAAAAALAVVGAVRPDLAPLCFQPTGQVVCPTGMATLQSTTTATGQPPPTRTAAQEQQQDRLARKTADPVDVLLVEAIGLIAAALASAAALRGMRGTSTPYGVPLALAVLKLPTGALTALLGLLLMRGQFIPGLSALDSPAQIIAWAIVLGYAQQLFTRFVDQRAQSVLGDAGGQERRRLRHEGSRAPARPSGRLTLEPR